VQEAKQVINSKGWWNTYFIEHWEANNGRNQTRHFMERLLSTLPDSTKAYLHAHVLDILDWGCAMGDGVKMLSQAFPQSHVVGLDFSTQAIEAARNQYPECEFIVADRIPREFDVIITSNCLEHFEKPLDQIREHLHWCKKLYIILVPYNECPLIDQHRAQFREESFPERLENFTRLCAEPIEVDPMYWTGKQLLVMYGAPAHVRELAISITGIEEEQRGNPLSGIGILEEKPSELLNILLAAALVQRMGTESRVSHLRAQVDLLEELQKREALVYAEKEGHLVAERDQLVAEHQRLATERSHLVAERDQLAAERDQLAAGREDLIAQLNLLYSTKAWKLTYAYWNLRRDGLKGWFRAATKALKFVARVPFRLLYRVIHTFYHLLVPRRLRVAFWEYRWRLAHKPVSSIATTSTALVSSNNPLANPPAHANAKNNKHIFIFALVPYYDIGGGQRPAQLAKTFNKMGYSVHYIYAYDSSDSGKKEHYFPLEKHVQLQNLTPKEVVSSLKGDPIFIFEAPYKDFLPYLELARRIRARVIYEHIDNWDTSLGNYFSFSVDLLKQFLRNADVTITTAQVLRDKLNAIIQEDQNLSQCASKVFYAANAVDTDLFDSILEQHHPKDLIVGRRTLLYYGSLWGEWFDWNLLRQVATKCEECAINLIGDYENWPQVKAIMETMPKNVQFLGPKLQRELPAYLRYSDIALLPFRNDEIGKYVSPLKIFEYIGMDKPILATNLPDIEGYPNVYASDEADDWVAFVKNELPACTGQGPAFARKNNWYARCNYLLDLIEPVHPVPERGTISIIILNRNNANIITRCIDSLIEFRARYQYKVIVVDNQSTDGSYELLHEKYNNDILLLRNNKNGCSSGRNLGVKQAKGNFILFLDSDQWAVSARWLEAPLDVLRRNRNIGAVGWGGGWFFPNHIGDMISAHLPYSGVEPALLFRTDIGYLGTCGMLIRREVLDATDGFDENLDPTCYEDTDLSLQIRDLGFELACCPYMNIVHLPHQTTQANSPGHLQLMERNGKYFKNKWLVRNPRLLEYYYTSNDLK
jgi:GT2 family glycosyltransferase